MKANAPRILAILTLLTAFCLSIASLVARDSRLALIPPDGTLQAAAEFVQSNYRPGDTVVVVPTWRVVMGHRLTQGPKALPPSALHQGDRVDPIELATARRVWVIAMFYKAPVLDARGVDLGEPNSTQDLGDGVTVASYEQAPIKPLARLTSDLRRLKVTRTAPGGKPKACRLRGNHHHCSPGPNVDVRTDDVFHRPVRWLFVQPGPGTTVATVHWPLRDSKGRQLAVRVGNNLGAVRKPGGTPVTVTVAVDGAVLATLTLPPHEYSLKRALVALPDGGSATAKAPQITFTIQADDPKRRYLLMEATVYDEALPDELQQWLGSGQADE